MDILVKSKNRFFVATVSKKYYPNSIEELKRIDKKINVLDRYPDGVFTFSTRLPGDILHEELKKNRPVFLRHIFPVDCILRIDGQSGTTEQINSAVIDCLEGENLKDRKVAVQARRIPGDYKFTLFDIKKNLDPVIAGRFGAVPTIRDPEAVISVFIVDSSKIPERNDPEDGHVRIAGEDCWNMMALIGFSTAEDNLSRWPGGIIRFSRDEDQVSRAEFKLLEAFEVFPIANRGGNALDLGASPGGWTKILMEKGYRVLAVDKAPLADTVSSSKNVRFVKKDARNFKDQKKVYDIITNDMNRDPVQSARALLSMADVAKPGADIIMTIKLPVKDPVKIIEKTVKTLESSFDILGLQQLYHNRDEVTLWAKKRE